MSFGTTRTSRQLEDAFFLEQDRVLKEQRAKLKQEEESMDSLSNVSGITDKTVLKELVSLGIRPETLAALCLTPIIEVAWADGKVDEKEINAILEGARKNGLEEDRAILQEWLHRKPDPKFMDAWKKYVQELSKVASKETMAAMKSDIVGHARAVAEASGTFLGLTNPVSPAERKLLDEIASVFKQVE